VPPKCWFPKPRPRLITVRTCTVCNHAFGRDDEELRAYLAAIVGSDTPARSAFWKQARAGIHKNDRIRRELLSGPELLVREGIGKPFELRRRVLLNADLHTRVFQRIIRALYKHERGSILPLCVPIEIGWIRDPEPYRPLFSQKKIVLLNEHFQYCFARAADAHATAWLLALYDHHFVVAFTGSLADDHERQDTVQASFFSAVKRPRFEPVRWTVYILRAKAERLGSVMAKDKAEAMELAIKECDIREQDRFRVSVRRA
jgi:hypothetical protein